MTDVPLPPLPSLPGDAGSEALPGGPSILGLLGRAHRDLTDRCARLVRAGQDAATPDAAELAGLTTTLVAGLSRHLSAEEQYLFPTVRAVLPDGDALADAEIEADQALRHALLLLESGPPADLAGLREVSQALRAHVERCERDLFPRVRTAVDEADLIRLGNRAEIAEEAAPTRPHPAAPSTPPWNKLVDPAVGVVDKVRDVLTRRATRPTD